MSGEKLRNQKGAAAILAVMGLLLGIIFLITNTSDRLVSIAGLNIFIHKRTEQKRIIDDIKASLNSISICTTSIPRLGRDIEEIKDGNGNIIFNTYNQNSTESIKDILYKSTRIAKMKIRDELDIKKANFKLATAYLDIYIADKSSFTQGMINCVENNSNPENCTGVKKESIKLQVELMSPLDNQGNIVSKDIISCSTSLPALKQLTCESVKTSVACGLFVYHLNIGEGEFGDEKIINIYPILPPNNVVEYSSNHFGDIGYKTGSSIIPQIVMILIPGSHVEHLRSTLPVAPLVNSPNVHDDLKESIKTRMYQFDANVSRQPYNGGARASCSHGVWSIQAECSEVWP